MKLWVLGKERRKETNGFTIFLVSSFFYRKIFQINFLKLNRNTCIPSWLNLYIILYIILE